MADEAEYTENSWETVVGEGEGSGRMRACACTTGKGKSSKRRLERATVRGLEG